MDAKDRKYVENYVSIEGYKADISLERLHEHALTGDSLHAFEAYCELERRHINLLKQMEIRNAQHDAIHEDFNEVCRERDALLKQMEEVDDGPEGEDGPWSDGYWERCGLAIVPLEPTEKMVHAAIEAVNERDGIGIAMAIPIYKAMIAVREK